MFLVSIPLATGGWSFYYILFIKKKIHYKEKLNKPSFVAKVSDIESYFERYRFKYRVLL